MAIDPNAKIPGTENIYAGGMTYGQLEYLNPSNAMTLFTYFGGANVAGSGGDYSDLDSFQNYSGFGTNTIPFDAWKIMGEKAGLGEENKLASDMNVISGSTGYNLGDTTAGQIGSTDNIVKNLEGSSTYDATLSPYSTASAAVTDNSSNSTGTDNGIMSGGDSSNTTTNDGNTTFYDFSDWGNMSSEQRAEQILKLSTTDDSTNPAYSMYDLDGDGEVTAQDSLAYLKAHTDNTAGTNTTTNNTTTTVDNSADFAGVNQGIAGVSGQVGGVQGTADQIVGDVAGVKTDVGGVAEDVAGVKTDVGGVQDTLGTPADGETVLGNQASILADMASKFDAALTDRNSQTAKIIQEIQDKYGLTETQIKQMSQDVLGGQSSITTDLSKLNTSLDTYYGGLAGTQAEMQDSLKGLGTDVTGFRTAFDENVTAQNKATGQLMSSVAGGFDAASTQRQAIAGQSPSTGTLTSSDIDSLMGGSAATAFSDAAKAVSQNVAPTDSQSIGSHNSFLATLNNLKNVVTEMVEKDPSNMLLPTIGQVADAFDQNGKLIAESSDDTGVQKRRYIDEEGNLITSTFDSTGSRTNQTTINLDTIFNQYKASYNATGADYLYSSTDGVSSPFLDQNNATGGSVAGDLTGTGLMS